MASNNTIHFFIESIFTILFAITDLLRKENSKLLEILTSMFFLFSNEVWYAMLSWSTFIWIANSSDHKRFELRISCIRRYYVWKKITKRTGKIILTSTYRWKNRTKFRKCVPREKLVHRRSTTDTSRSRTRRIQFIIFIYL